MAEQAKVVRKLMPNRHPHNVLKTDLVPMFGHSMGGGSAAIAMSMGETRIAGALNLDGEIPPIKTTYINGVKNPYMIINNPESLGETSWDRLWPHLNWGLQFQLQHSTHGTFLDNGLLAQLMGVKITPDLAEAFGTIPGERYQEILVEYVNAFAQYCLHGKESMLLKGASVIPEMKFVRSEGM